MTAKRTGATFYNVTATQAVRLIYFNISYLATYGNYVPADGFGLYLLRFAFVVSLVVIALRFNFAEFSQVSFEYSIIIFNLKN